MRHAVESNNVSEESLCHGLCRIRVSQGNEVAILVEAINHCQDDRFSPDARQRLNKVQTAYGTGSGMSRPAG